MTCQEPTANSYLLIVVTPCQFSHPSTALMTFCKGKAKNTEYPGLDLTFCKNWCIYRNCKFVSRTFGRLFSLYRKFCNHLPTFRSLKSFSPFVPNFSNFAWFIKTWLKKKNILFIHFFPIKTLRKFSHALQNLLESFPLNSSQSARSSQEWMGFGKWGFVKVRIQVL